MNWPGTWKVYVPVPLMVVPAMLTVVTLSASMDGAAVTTAVSVMPGPVTSRFVPSDTVAGAIPPGTATAGNESVPPASVTLSYWYDSGSKPVTVWPTKLNPSRWRRKLPVG